MRDRRNIERYSLSLPAKIKVSGKTPDGDIIISRTKDISSSGAYIVTDAALPEGTSIEVEFDLSIAKLVEMMGKTGYVRVKVEGKVARTDVNGVAVKFSKDYEIQPLDE